MTLTTGLLSLSSERKCNCHYIIRRFSHEKTTVLSLAVIAVLTIISVFSVHADDNFRTLDEIRESGVVRIGVYRKIRDEAQELMIAKKNVESLYDAETKDEQQRQEEKTH